MALTKSPWQRIDRDVCGTRSGPTGALQAPSTLLFQRQVVARHELGEPAILRRGVDAGVDDMTRRQRHAAVPQQRSQPAPVESVARIGTTYDASFGVSRDAWTAQVYAQNLTDTRGKVFLSDSQALQTQTVTRPRVIGVKFGYKFGGR